MPIQELVKSPSELEEIAEILLNQVEGKRNCISRFTISSADSVTYVMGKRKNAVSSFGNMNLEDLDSRVYSQTEIDDLTLGNVFEAAVQRDLNSHHYSMAWKGNLLPSDQLVYNLEIPSNQSSFDREIREFTKCHPNSKIKRTLRVVQKVIVNSRIGVAIQTIPFFSISYISGYNPLLVSRELQAVCKSNEDIRRFSSLIKYMPDPTLDGEIKSSRTFSQAFDKLYGLSGLKFGSFDDAGIPITTLYDVVMLTGVPVHEIFGHHFEEPIGIIEFGEIGNFKYGQKVSNKGLVLMDDPERMIEGFNVLGFTFFDAYGRPRPKRIHISEGKIEEFLGGEYMDPGKLKTYLGADQSPFFGNSSQEEGNFPHPRMSCTVLDGKTEKIDLEGRILLVPNSGHTQPMDKTYRVDAYEAYIVKHGEPLRIVPVMVTGGINQAFENLVLLEDFSYNSGLCMKMDPVTRCSAHIPVSQFSRNQLWKSQQVYSLPIPDYQIQALNS